MSSFSNLSFANLESIPMTYTYNDVSLVPQYSSIESRLNTDLSTQMTRNIRVSMPLIPANMDTVIDIDLAKIVVEKGGMPIFHRYCSIEKQREFVQSVDGHCFVSCGLQKEDIEKVKSLLDMGARGVCFDVAHGHCNRMIDAVKYIKECFPGKDVIAGNVCTLEGYIDLVNAGADAVKVGVGSGSICTTRMVTGHGVSMFSALMSMKDEVRKTGVPIIADGGITHNRDVVLAIAAGANTVMIGSLFAKTLESAGEKYEKDGKLVKVYRGQASREFQNEYYGKVKKGTAPEGVAGWVECTQSAYDFIDEFCGGIRSGLTYTGVANIADFQKNAKFVRAYSTSSYMNESKSRL